MAARQRGMTEARWLGSKDPAPMLLFLQHRATNRKLGLFGCACARRVWGLLADPRSRGAIEAAEGYWDGEVSLRDYQEAAVAGQEALYAAQEGERAAACAAQAALRTSLGRAWADVARAAGDGAERATLCDLVRDVFGNPYHTPRIARPWPARPFSTIARLAQAAYDERALPAGTLDPVRLAVLADALEEAGVTDTFLVAHLRGPGVHVRGCLAVDAVLGKG
jgi:hypothetical protein